MLLPKGFIVSSLYNVNIFLFVVGVSDILLFFVPNLLLCAPSGRRTKFPVSPSPGLETRPGPSMVPQQGVSMVELTSFNYPNVASSTEMHGADKSEKLNSPPGYNETDSYMHPHSPSFNARLTNVDHASPPSVVLYLEM